MIDDKFSKWYPILEKTAKQYDFCLTNAPSVEAGLEKLENYKGSFEAVILGLAFTTGEIQGREGLLKIKEIDDSLPVIILTAKTDDFQLISECIRMGAYDYFAKPNVNTGRLFLHIENAIQKSAQQKKILNFAKTVTDNNAVKPFFHFTAKDDKPDKGYFAYRLNSVACSSFDNKPEAEYLCQLAAEWHSNFLNTISFYDSGLTIRLRYLYKPGSDYIDPVLIVEFDVRSYEEAIIKFNEIHNEFDLFMQAKKEFGKTIYFFSPIIEEADLLNTLFPFSAATFVQIVPEFTELSQSNLKSVGFSSAKKDNGKRSITLPALMMPEIKLDRFCEQLTNQKSRTMVEIVLSPVKLSRNEVDYLRDALNNISNYFTTNPEKERASQIISTYLQAPSKCFNVEVFEAQETKRVGESMLSAISAAFFESATLVKTTPVKVSVKEILKKEEKREAERDWNYLYSLCNILNVFKFPYPYSASIPGIKTHKQVYGYIPENLSKTGIQLGEKKTGNVSIPVTIDVDDLSKHLYILGQTGTGKTTVLYSMIMDRIKAGKGVCVIDPHGDLFRNIMINMPVERRKDVIHFEPGLPNNKIRINLLEYNKANPQEKSFLIDDLFNFFKQEYEYIQISMGPIFELFMKNALLLLMDDPDDLGTIADVSRVFQDSTFRTDLLKKCKDQDVVEFWKETAIRMTGENNLTNMTPYIVSKLNQLTMNEFVKPIISTKASNINFREVIDNDKILMVSLSKGKIGKIGVNILGTIVLSRIINAALSRQDLYEDSRKNFTLFVDEFQNFMSHSVMYAMSEARKYRLSLVLANQTLGQLSDNMKHSILGNVGSTIFFRPGINDVDYVMPYFTPYLTRENVLTLPNYKCIGRLQIQNTLSLPFIFDTVQPK